MNAQRRIYWLTWINCGWQVVFGLGWGFWGQHAAQEAWGSGRAALIQGVACLGPTLIVAAIVFRWLRRLGIWP